MARRPLTKPRKVASQERSRATVDALVEATARILVKEGFDKASTNRIAEVAGVSVGSLYQYFPSKEALVAAVIERHQQEIMQTVRGELAEVSVQPVEKACASSSPSRLRRIVSIRSCIGCSRNRFRAWESSRRWRPSIGRTMRCSGRTSRAIGTKFVLDDLELAAFVCVTSIEALTHNGGAALLEVVSDKATEALIDEARAPRDRISEGLVRHPGWKIATA